MDISKIKKEDFPKMKVWELCAYIRAAKPEYKFCGYLPKENALIAANAIYDETHQQVQPSKRKPISWREYFMGLAKLSAQRSKDPKCQVGCCIIDPKSHKILSIGYNGLPYGMEDTDEIWNSDNKHNFVVHAEANAVLNANQADLEGAEVYVTMFPCKECAKLLAQKKISKVIYDNDKFLYKDDAAALEIFSVCGIKVERYSGGTSGN